MKPTPEEAKTDLANIREEIKAMRLIVENARFLSTRDDVDRDYFRTVVFKTENYVQTGLRLEKHILDLYPELR